MMTVDEYYAHWERGEFEPQEKLELVDGEVIFLERQSPQHAWAGGNLSGKLRPLLPHAYFRSHSPLRLDDYNEPEPDLLIARGPMDQYWKRHPGAADTLLVVETADKSLAKDQSVKAELYARFGIEDYWLINLIDNLLEVYRQPEIVDGNGRYRSLMRFSHGDYVSLFHAPNCTISVSEVLPPI